MLRKEYFRQRQFCAKLNSDYLFFGGNVLHYNFIIM